MLSVAERQHLEAALDYVREGDQFAVTKLDRLARSVGDLLAIVARLLIAKARGSGPTEGLLGFAGQQLLTSQQVRRHSDLYFPKAGATLGA